MNKVRVIDILNKIANGEEVRFRIYSSDETYHWNKNEYMIFENTGKEEQWYIDKSWLNEEVEIIEENKKIEKLEKDRYISGSLDGKSHWEEEYTLENIGNKINEIIDYLNNKEN